MKQNIFIKWSIAISVLLFLLVSCYKDKGNYDYIQLDQITFGGIAERYEIDFGMPLTIMPTVTHSLPGSEDQYTYLWIRIIGANNWDTIYRERYIDNVVLERLRNNTAHTMVYQAINMETGIAYTSDRFVIQVNNDIRQGFMLLLNDGGETDLKFINYFSTIPNGTGSKLVMRNVPLPDIPEVGAPVDIATYVDNNAPRPGSGRNYAVSLVTETGLYRLDHTDFSYVPENNGTYVIIGDNVEDIRFSGIYVPSNKTQISNSVTAILRDDKGNFMYHQLSSYIPWAKDIFCNKYVVDGVEQPFTPFHHIGYVMSMVAVFYDLDNRCFALKATNRNYCEQFTADTPLFPYNNTPFEPLWMFMRPSDNLLANNAVYSVVKDRSTGALDLISFTAVVATSVQAKYPLWPQTNEGTTLPGINNAKLFAMNVSGTSTDYRGLFFYATDNEIHVYDLLDRTYRRVFSAPAGHTVVDMKIIPSQAVTPAGNANNDFQNHMIVVTKGTGPNSTSVGIYEVTPMYGTLTLKHYDNSEGGMDCIWDNLPDYVGIDWKAKS